MIQGGKITFAEKEPQTGLMEISAEVNIMKFSFYVSLTAYGKHECFDYYKMILVSFMIKLSCLLGNLDE